MFKNRDYVILKIEMCFCRLFKRKESSYDATSLTTSRAYQQKLTERISRKSRKKINLEKDKRKTMAETVFKISPRVKVIIGPNKLKL